MKKKSIPGILLLLFLALPLNAQITGDVNSDGTVNIVDGLMTAQFYVGLNPAPFNQAAADVNCDSSVNIVDALMIAQFYVGLIPGFTACSTAPPTNPPPPAGQPDYSPIGFCNDGSTITGGSAGPTVYVSSAEELEQYSDVEDPYTIYITSSFAIEGMDTHIRSNKTVIGQGNITLTGGGLYLYRASNVIIRNLTITGSSEDNMGLHYSDHVWIDHCTIVDSDDGGIDITQESDYITISWCKFYYNADNGHNFVNLIAASDSDNGSQYHVTFHHNWWGELCVERMPSVRFGRAHIFNNYYNAPGSNYCVRTRIEAECRVENNFFENVQNPWEQYITGSGTQGKLYASGNNITTGSTDYGVTWITDGSSRLLLPGTDSVFAAPYAYTLDNAGNVKSIVTANAGAGQGPF